MSKRFGDFLAVDNVSLEIRQGEFFSLLGGSGCGKSTLLRMLAGLETPTTGRVLIDGVDMTRTPPYRRPVNMMFQSYALFPHLNVFGNVAFGLRQDGIPRAEVAERVADALALVELTDFAKRKPDQLSGGQQQRVALARALVKRPRLLLLDEPLAALDKNLRERTQRELARIQERVGITFVLVTHDQQEAMNLSSRIAVMQSGRLEQVGTPEEIYEAPANRFVASFVGTVNLAEGTVRGPAEGGTAVACPELGELVTSRGEGWGSKQRCWVALRPEQLTLSADTAADGAPPNSVAGTLEDAGYLGTHWVYDVRTAAGAALRITGNPQSPELRQALTIGAPVRVSWPPAAVILLPE